VTHREVLGDGAAHRQPGNYGPVDVEGIQRRGDVVRQIIQHRGRRGIAGVSMVAELDSLFVDAVAKAIRASGLMGAYKATGLIARQLADTLYATARGLKYTSATREAFVDGMTLAVRAMCAPLREAP